jgi:hypothetical protein
MRITFRDDQFDEWEAYVSGGQPGSSLAARIMFVCVSTPENSPRQTVHKSGDPAAAEYDLYNMDEASVKQLFASSEPIA